MPNKCVAQGCSTGNLTEVSAREENVATFHFPVKKPELLSRWTRFVNKPSLIGQLRRLRFYVKSISRRMSLKEEREQLLIGI